jgi:hypothetical protein
MRHIKTINSVTVRKNAPRETLRLAEVVQSIMSKDEYIRQALTMHGPSAIELAMRGRDIEELAKSIDVSPKYLSHIKHGHQRISLKILHRLLSECEGVSR